MGTIVEFRLLDLDLLNYNSKAELPINRSAKVVISRNLTISWHSNLFIYLFIYLLIYLFIYLYVYRKQALLSYLNNDSNRCYWLVRMNKK